MRATSSDAIVGLHALGPEPYRLSARAEVSRPMTLSIRALTDRRHTESQAIIAYLTAERDLFRLHGAHAEQHIDDEDRRRLTPLAHALGWQWARKHARIVTAHTLRRWWRTLIDTSKPPAACGGRKPTSPE